jgi:hypothetical protein
VPILLQKDFSHPDAQTSAAGSLQQTESRFVDYREAFFNSIDPLRT